MSLQQSYGMSTYSIAPNINIFNYNLSYAFAYSNTFRVYNLNKITVPVNISGICFGCSHLNHNLKLPPYITNASNAFAWCRNLSMPVIFKNQNIDDTSGMFMGCNNLNNNIIIQDCIFNNASHMFEFAAAYSNEIIVNNVIINNAHSFMNYMTNCPFSSKHFEINVKVNNASAMFWHWTARNYNEPIYIDNSNFSIISANNNIFSSPGQLYNSFGICDCWYLRNTNFYIGNGNYSEYVSEFCRFGWADNCNFTIGDGHSMRNFYNFVGGDLYYSKGGTVQNCNFNFGNNWNDCEFAFYGTALIDNCNFNFGNNYNYIYQIFRRYNNLTLINLNVNFGDNYNKFSWDTIQGISAIDCNFNFGNNYNNIISSFNVGNFINCNIILGNNIKNIYQIFNSMSRQKLFGDFYFKVGDNIEELTDLTSYYGLSIYNTVLNSFSFILGNNINNVYEPIKLSIGDGEINRGNIIIGNNINKIYHFINSFYSNMCSNFNISIGHNINNIYGAVNYLGNNSHVFIGNNINYLGSFLSFGSNVYHNQNYSLNNINIIDNYFLLFNENSLYKGELKFSNVNFINGLIIGTYSTAGYFNGNIYLNDVNTINTLINRTNWVDGNLYLNNVNYINTLIFYTNWNSNLYLNNINHINGLIFHTNWNSNLYLNNINDINGLIFYCDSFNQNIDFPSTLQSFNRVCVYCNNFNQNFQIPRNVLCMDQTFLGCANFNQNIIIPNSVISLNETFWECTNFNQNIIIPNSVKHFKGTFYNTNKYYSLYWYNYIKETTDFNNILSYTYMFRGWFDENYNENFNFIWPPNVINLAGSFQYSNYIPRPMREAEIPNKVQDISRMFWNSTFICNENRKFIPDSVINMSGTFYNCRGHYGANFYNYISNNVEDLSWCFAYMHDPDYDSNSFSLPNKVKNLSHCFYNCYWRSSFFGDISIYIYSLNVQNIEGFLGYKHYAGNMDIFIYKNSQTFNTFLNQRNTIISGVTLNSYANNNGFFNRNYNLYIIARDLL